MKIYKKESLHYAQFGRLSPQKGYDRLLKVVKKLNNCGMDYDLWIIGVGTEEGKLRKYIEENNLLNVKLLGYKENPWKYIRLSDIFVCSSRAEGFSTVVSEAIILEKPILTTDCSGMKEMLGENGEYGVICQNNEEDLYNKLVDMLKNKEKYEHYKEKIKERKDRFNIKRSVSEIELLLKN